MALAAVGAAAAPSQLSDEQVTSAVKEIIAQRSKEGVFVLHRRTHRRSTQLGAR